MINYNSSTRRSAELAHSVPLNILASGAPESNMRGSASYGMFLAILFLMFIPFSSAEVQNLPDQEIGTCVTIEQTCASCSYVNFESIKYPNSTMIYYGLLMDAEGFKYTSDFCDVNQEGYYIVTTCGDVDGTDTCVEYGFNATSETGIKLDLFSAVILSFIFIISLVAFVFRIYVLSGLFLILIGIVLLFSPFNVYISFVLIALGVAILFIK